MKAQDMTPGRNGWKPTANELYSWLDRQILCTFGTIGENGYPNAATVAFSQTPSLDFIIITDASSRKAHNVRTTNKVSLTVTNEDDRYTVQCEGDARELPWAEFAKYEDSHYRKLPYSLPFKDIPGQVPILIHPTSMRFSDVSVRPWELTKIV